MCFANRAPKMPDKECGPILSGRPGRRVMDELTERLVAKVGIDRATAVLAIGAILGFLRSEGPADKVQAIIDQLPGSEAAIASADAAGGGIASLIGGGVMALGAKLMGAGLGMGEIQGVVREVIAFAREKIGPEAVAEIVEAIPGASQFI